jgi:pyruvate kinase
MNRRAKIVGTLGPASDDDAVLRSLLDGGLDVIRLNLSHGTREGHQQAIARVRRLAAETSRHVPVILDLMGPRYRLGELVEEADLQRGSLVRFGSTGDDVDLAIDDPALLAALQPGERILIDNGLVELRVTGSPSRCRLPGRELRRLGRRR